MQIHRYLILSLLPAILLIIPACQDKTDEPAYTGENDPIEFELVFDTRTPTKPDDLEKFEDYFKEDESCVYISQRSGSIGLDFTEGSNNRYEYIYFSNPTADWDQGYNFRSEHPLDWGKIQDNGQWGNGFAFGALFYPRGYVDEIPSDQSNKDVFIEADILGAYHRTSLLRDRLRFQLNHLMCRLHVNLYIPVYDEKEGNGITVKDVEAYALNLMTAYSIEWGDVPSEWSPVTSAINSDQTFDIKMYRKEADIDVEELDIQPFTGIDGETDHVKKFSFEALFPYQAVSSGNILRFIVAHGNSKTNYLFNGFYGDSFSFKQGAVTQLELYLSRTDNKLVVLRALLKDWSDAEAEFTITPIEGTN